MGAGLFHQKSLMTPGKLCLRVNEAKEERELGWLTHNGGGNQIGTFTVSLGRFDTQTEHGVV